MELALDNTDPPQAIVDSHDHVPWLDGLRGGASLWVLISHVNGLSGGRRIPLLSWGGLAVDLFMLLSGFLMAHHYVLRRDQEPWDKPQTFATFWLRRFFRIAPLYYLLLAAALLLGPALGEYREAIERVWPNTATEAARYSDQSLANIGAHLSFVFGALPEYAFRTALPDWSIGLEMQFYLAFPFVMLALSRIGWFRGGILIVLGCLALRFALPGFFGAFEMPSFLPMKMYLFVIGIWMALGRRQATYRTSLLLSLCTCLVGFALERTAPAFARIGLVVGMFYLMDVGRLPTPPPLAKTISHVRAALSHPIGRFVGDTSYGTYLLHLLVVLPIVGTLATHGEFTALPWPVRTVICLGLSLPLVYTSSWLLYHFVEREGIGAGKRIARALRSREKLEPLKAPALGGATRTK